MRTPSFFYNNRDISTCGVASMVMDEQRLFFWGGGGLWGSQGELEEAFATNRLTWRNIKFRVTFGLSFAIFLY